MKKTVLKIIKIKAENNMELYKKLEEIKGTITRVISIEENCYDVYYEVKENIK